MQEFKTAPENQEAYNRLGHAAAVCTGVIFVFSVIGIVTEALPLQSMINAAVGKYILPLIGEQVTYFITMLATLFFVIYLAVEHIKVSKAAFNTLGKDAEPIRQALTPIGVSMLWLIAVFVISARVSLTFIGSHQLAYVAIKPPELNTDAITANDTLYNIRKREQMQEVEKQRQNVINDNNAAIKAVKRAAYASEQNALQQVKNAPNEYRKNIARANLQKVRNENAEKIALANAKASEAILSITTAANNVITQNDSLNVAAKGMLLAADARQQSRFFWISDKLTAYFPYVSLICVFLVTVAVFVLCLIYRAAGIKVHFQQGKYDNVPGLVTVWLSVLNNIWQSRMRQFAAKFQRLLEHDLFSNDSVEAAAVGASNTVQVTGGGEVQTVTIAETKQNTNPVKPEPLPEPEKNIGRVIALKQAEAQLNTYKSRLKRGEGKPENCHARIKYFTFLIENMKSKGIYEMHVPEFNAQEWV